jgi:hypothetical protein
MSDATSLTLADPLPALLQAISARTSARILAGGGRFWNRR